MKDLKQTETGWSETNFNTTMETKKVTPDEIPAIAFQAMEIVRLFKLHVGVIPTTIPGILIAIPKLIIFFKAAKPSLEIVIKEIKD